VGAVIVGVEFSLATADGREEANFVARLERSVPGSEFLVTGGDEGGAEFAKLRLGGGAGLEEIFDEGAVAKLDGLFGGAGEFAETAEVKDFDGHERRCSFILPEFV
jgi:hypothetical protein